MMVKKYKILLVLFFAAITAMGCQKNFYTSKAKGNDCGCPNTKNMSGY